MKFNGYMLKDKIEQLGTKMSRAQQKAVKLNKYFASKERPKDYEQDNAIKEFNQCAEAMTKLSLLQMWYNTHVFADDGTTLHEVIKLQGEQAKRIRLWSVIAPRDDYTPEYISTEEKYEYAKVIKDHPYCQERIDELKDATMINRGLLRRLNGIMLDTDDDDILSGTDWETIFSL